MLSWDEFVGLSWDIVLAAAVATAFFALLKLVFD